MNKGTLTPVLRGVQMQPSGNVLAKRRTIRRCLTTAGRSIGGSGRPPARCASAARRGAAGSGFLTGG
jgi:hypothetical protein